MSYQICQDGGEYDEVESLGKALSIAEVLLGDASDSVFTISDDDGRVVATLSNKRIVGEFIKQRWAGLNDDIAANVAVVKFDATDYVLLLPYEKLVALNDDAFEQWDEIGRQHVDWAGPFEVYLLDEICDFFGVEEIADITPENHAFVCSRYLPQPHKKAVVNLNLRLDLNVAPRQEIQEIMSLIVHNIESRVPGITIHNRSITSGTVAMDGKIRALGDGEPLDPQKVVTRAGMLIHQALAMLDALPDEELHRLRGATDGNLPDSLAFAAIGAAGISSEMQKILEGGRLNQAIWKGYPKLA